MTYESGCAPWICANYAQLPKKPEVDTLKKIVFIGEFDAQGNRLLGTFTNEVQDVIPEAEIFNKDRGLKGRIIRGDYAAPMIRILYEHLDPNFNAEDDIPKVLRELRDPRAQKLPPQTTDARDEPASGSGWRSVPRLAGLPRGLAVRAEAAVAAQAE